MPSEISRVAPRIGVLEQSAKTVLLVRIFPNSHQHYTQPSKISMKNHDHFFSFLTQGPKGVAILVVTIWIHEKYTGMTNNYLQFRPTSHTADLSAR
jgi:hypothetical protein